MPEFDFSSPSGDDFKALSRDTIPVRSMVESDLPAIIGIDRKITGYDRSSYFKRKLHEVLNETGVRVSLVAEMDGQFAGFIMAKLDYGEFGRTANTAVIDTIGVNPAFGRQNVGNALLTQLNANLASLRVERLQTQIAWNNYALLGFLEKAGFRPSQRLAFSKRLD